MTKAVEIRKVESKSDFEAFFKFLWKIYDQEKYPYWGPEVPMLRRSILDKEQHVAWEHMDGDYFIALRDGEIVGEIAAFVNHQHNEFYKENIGFFGFFESIDDQAVADALLTTAEDYLRAKGVDAIRGPASFSSNDEWGLLIDGFETDPMFLIAWNPPYYQQLIENAGYEKAMDLFSWRKDYDRAKDLFYADPEHTDEARIVKAVRRNIERRGIEIRYMDMSNKQDEFNTMLDIYHQAWNDNWGFVPMTDKELQNMVDDLGMLLMKRYTYIASMKGEDVGFMLLIPNFDNIMQYVDPKPSMPLPVLGAKTLWHWKIRNKVKSLRIILMGVKEQYRGLGVDAAMFLTLAEEMIAETGNLEYIEASWVLETNNELNRIAEHFGSELNRRHRIYEKTLQP